MDRDRRGLFSSSHETVLGFLLLATGLHKTLNGSLADFLNAGHTLDLDLLDLLAQASLVLVLVGADTIEQSLRWGAGRAWCLGLDGGWCKRGGRSRRAGDLDVAPQAVAEGQALSGLETPVRDGSALTNRGLENNAESNLLTSSHRSANNVALASLSKLARAQGTCVVEIEHVVTSNVADAAAGRPGLRTGVADCPDLDKLETGADLGAIGDGVTDKVSIELLLDRLGLLLERDRHGSLERLGAKSSNLLNRLREEIANLNLVLGSLWLWLLGWLDVSHGLDLRSGVGGRGRYSLGGGRLLGRLTVAHTSDRRAVLVFVHGGDTNAAHRALELDQRMGVVVPIRGVSLAVGAEVGVMAHSTLVSGALDIRYAILVLTERTVTVDTIVAVAAAHRLGQGLVDRDKAMSRVDELGALDTLGAEVPVGAVEALVAHTIDELLAPIANSGVAHVPARIAKEICKGRHGSLLGGSLEGMAGVVAVLVVDVALHAKIVVFTGGAGNELTLVEDWLY